MKTVFLVLTLAFSLPLFANDPNDSLQLFQEQLRKIDSIESRLNYKTGRVLLAGNKVNINVPANYKFLDSTDARYILEEVWGNLKGQTALGMLVPASSMATLADYAFIVEYQDIGYVKDDDAKDINYTELLTEMKEESAETNKLRIEAGIPGMSLVGWASAPFYDKERNVLHWAKEYAVEGEEGNTLNYDVRVLGRQGVLVLQAVSSMDQLDSVKQNITPLLGAVAFTQGNRYSDFNEKTDNVAAWTIGGLVAGKVLAKAGFFAFIGKFLKVIILGVASLFGAAFKYFKRKKNSQEPLPAYETAQEQEA